MQIKAKDTDEKKSQKERSAATKSKVNEADFLSASSDSASLKWDSWSFVAFQLF